MKTKHSTVKRRAAALFAFLLGSAFIVPLVALAPTAGATESSPGGIEICKTFTQAPIAVNQSASFVFTIAGGPTVTVPAGTCSTLQMVSGGTHVITETGYVTPSGAIVPTAPTFSVTNIAPDPGFPALVSSSLANQTATVSVNGSVNGGVSEVRFTNKLNPGFVEVCKAAFTGSGLTGSFSFNITGADGFVGTATSPVGACSGYVEVPAGTVTTTEAGTNLYVTSLTANINGTGPSAIVNDNLTSGSATVNVHASNDPSTQTDVYYTNNVVNFKVCKSWSNDNGAETLLANGVMTSFPFTESASGVPGPNTAPGPFSLQAGQCSNPTPYRAGTVVTVTEGIVPGSKVEGILSAGGQSVVANSLSLTGRTIQVIVGTPYNSTGKPLNEAITTFTNEFANPGTLKICKFAGTPQPIGNSFTFTVTGGATGTGTIPLTACAFLLNSTGGIEEIPFNSTVTITESASTGNATSAISVIPTFVTEVVGSTPTLTTETALAGPPNFGSLNTVSSVNVVIGEGTVTEAAFTDIDPPANAVTGPSTTVDNPGVNGGTTTSASAAVASTVSSGIAKVIVGASTAKTLKPSKAQLRVKLAKEHHLLARVKAAIVRENKILKGKFKGKLKASVRKADVKHLAALKAEVKVLNRAIRLLK